MKKLSRLLCLMLAVVLSASVLTFLVGCDPEPKATTYTVTFKVNSDVVDTQKVKARQKVTPPAASKYDVGTGNRFVHWHNGANKSDKYDFSMEVTSNFELNAYYVADGAEMVTITIDLDGGEGLTEIQLEKGQSLTMPSKPRKTGSNFIAWERNGDRLSNSAFPITNINENFTLKAIWEARGVNFKPLILNLGEPDEKFTPFFSTSAYDSSVHGQTQIAMLSTDKYGKVDVGNHVPSVVLNYSQKVFVDGKQEDDPIPPGNDADKLDPEKYRTEYEFLIKNGIKFSDGKDLTIKDIIFNMYAYLDINYTGSSTMYSTKIVGLRAFREQNADLNEGGSGSALINEHTIAANDRLVSASKYFQSNTENRTAYRNNLNGSAGELQVLKDVQYLREQYWFEIVDSWKRIRNETDFAESYKSFEYTYDGKAGTGYEKVDEDWEAFLIINGAVSPVRDPISNKVVKEDRWKVPGDETTKYEVTIMNFGDTVNWLHDEDSLSKILFNNNVGILDNEEAGNYFSANQGTPNIDLVLNQAKDQVIGNMFDTDFDGNVSHNNVPVNQRTGWKTDNTTLAGRFVSGIDGGNYGATLIGSIPTIINYTSTGSNAFSKFRSESLDAHFEKMFSEGRKTVEQINGIEVFKMSKGSVFGGKRNKELTVPTTLDADYDVLKITIVGVDPKALLNFGFAVAPMHYYSQPKSGSGFLTTDGYESFNYPGVTGYDPTKPTHVGMMTHNAGYFEKVMNTPEIMKVPVGAGPFMATDENDSNNPLPSNFYKNNIVHFKSNEYFYTTGKDMNNVKFKHFRYQIINATRVLTSTEDGTIHLSDPSAKQENLDKVNQNPNLGVIKQPNNGYGYVGVNANFVHDVYIRRAIMTAMDTGMIMDYYVGDMAFIIDAPMSKESWAYPDNPVQYYKYPGSEQAAVDEVKRLISESDKANSGKYSAYTSGGADGSLRRQQNSSGQWEDLKFTFTIAGAETDHPAYNMFANAAKILEQCGFRITVSTDPNALLKLSNGELAVWAAAWQSSTDPDMFQVYHIDSQAQSVNNWGYPYIKANANNGAEYEYGIISGRLAETIEAGRETLDEEQRKDAYEAAIGAIMDLAVEYPTYQRVNLIVYSKTKFVTSTLYTAAEDITAFQGPLDKIWKVELQV